VLKVNNQAGTIIRKVGSFYRELIYRSSLLREQEGQSLVILALVLVVLCGFAGLVVDVGQSAATKAKMQNAADAAAFAGVNYLPNSPSGAISAGVNYSSYNAIPISNTQVTIGTTYYPNDTITVRPQRTVNYHLARAVGVTSDSITVTAKAVIGNLSGSNGVVPWGLVGSTVHPYGQSVTVRLYDGVTGDFQALSIDGRGASDYRHGVAYGTTTAVTIGSTWDTKPGAMDGPTEQALQTRWALDIGLWGNVQTFSDVVRNNGDGTFDVKEWQSRRVVVVPVVSGVVGPRTEMTVTQFAIFFIEDWDIHGNQLWVTGRFVNAKIPTTNFTPYFSNWGARVSKLIQ
jgi:Flp pilus assembly protein TadG